MKLSISKWRIIVVFWALAAGLGFSIYKDAVATFRDPIDLNQAQITDVENLDHVTMDVSMCLGAAFKETTTTKSKWTGKEKSSSESRYYMVPMLKDSAEGTFVDRVFVIKVPQNKFSIYEKATDLFWNYWEDETAPLPTEILEAVDGKIEKMDKEENAYLARTMTEYGMDSSMVGAYYVTPLVEKKIVLGVAAGAIVCFVIGLLLALFWKKDKRF